MYFVDRKLLEERLQYLEEINHVFSQQAEWESSVEKLALERIAHMMIEVMMDVGNQLIDGFIMRDPGSYNDVIDILIDERVLLKEEEKSYKNIIKLRKELLQNYMEIDHLQMAKLLQKELKIIGLFPEKVRRYLESELGPVSAFLPK
ncbi:MAG: DUF86 domain-containing protein [Bacillus sp. (in: Bacteria)]|nr:DUF86 domain-containing protein [Bacillus sp. (in: firmicutes)]